MAFVLGLLSNTLINAKDQQESYIEEVKLFVGESTEVFLSKDNISYDRKLLNVKKQNCEKNICFYKIKAKEKGNTFIKDKNRNEYKINIQNHEKYINKSKLSKEELYDYKIFALLQSYSISSMLEVENLTTSQRDDLFNKIELLKEEIYPENNYSALQRGNGGPGDVFLTIDSQTTSLIKHGHAGIGEGNGNVIEANPDKGVKSVKDSVKKYWEKCNKTTKRYTVVGSTTAQKKKALSVAESKKGKPYGIVATGDKYYFCTKLAWTAWDYSGAKNKIGHSWYASDMMKSKSLKVLETYHK